MKENETNLEKIIKQNKRLQIQNKKVNTRIKNILLENSQLKARASLIPDGSTNIELSNREIASLIDILVERLIQIDKDRPIEISTQIAMDKYNSEIQFIDSLIKKLRFE